MIELLERITSREWTNTGGSFELRQQYICYATADDEATRDWLLANIPATHPGLGGLPMKRDRLEITPVTVDEEDDTGHYEVIVTYVTQKPESTAAVLSFDTAGGSQHVTQSRQTVGSYAAPGETAPDFQGAIGVTADQVEGVDIVVPVFNFQYQAELTDDQMSAAYQSTLYQLTGRVNSAAWKGFSAGEVLFLGASASQRFEPQVADFLWDITWYFSASPNVTGLSVGPITGISKKGWEYLWVRYEDAEDTTAHKLVKRPIAAYVEKVYLEGDLNALSIP